MLHSWGPSSCGALHASSAGSIARLSSGPTRSVRSAGSLAKPDALLRRSDQSSNPEAPSVRDFRWQRANVVASSSRFVSLSNKEIRRSSVRTEEDKTPQ